MRYFIAVTESTPAGIFDSRDEADNFAKTSPLPLEVFEVEYHEMTVKPKPHWTEAQAIQEALDLARHGYRGEM